MVNKRKWFGQAEQVDAESYYYDKILELKKKII